MLDIIKLTLRISGDALDDDIENNISACKLDLKRVGVAEDKIVDSDALIVKVVELYCKWMLNFEERGDRYAIAYEKMRDGLSLCGEYNV